MTGAELRVVGGRNMIDLTDDEVDRVRAAVEAHGMDVVCARLAAAQVRAAGFAAARQPRAARRVRLAAHVRGSAAADAARAFEIAERLGARIIRVFSYWRTIEPERTFDRVAEALLALGDEAATRGVVIGLENEHACNVGTGAEASRHARERSTIPR